MAGSGLNSWGNILLSASTTGMLPRSKISSPTNQGCWRKAALHRAVTRARIPDPGSLPPVETAKAFIRWHVCLGGIGISGYQNPGPGEGGQIFNIPKIGPQVWRWRKGKVAAADCWDELPRLVCVLLILICSFMGGC